MDLANQRLFPPFKRERFATLIPVTRQLLVCSKASTSTQSPFDFIIESMRLFRFRSYLITIILNSAKLASIRGSSSNVL
jgi:hypothetical protein